MIKLMFFVYLYLIMQMCLVWVIYRILKNPSIVDVSWSIGLIIAGLIYTLSKTFTLHNLLLSALLVIWGLRLAGYLWISRVAKGHVDKRYTKLSDDWKINKSLGFFLNFQLQAVFIFIISISFSFASNTQQTSLSMFDMFAAIVVVCGIIGETIADLQLQKFKAFHKGKVCDVGLWQYCRHPNYFFDWLTWCGFALFSLNQTYGFIGLISPIFLYFIFTHITGPLTEQGSIQSRGETYQRYQARTPMFFPSFKRK